MKKITTLIMALSLFVVATLTGCTGGGGKTVESYVKDAKASGAFDSITQAAGDMMDIEIEGTEDTLILKYTLTDAIPGTAEELKEQFETALTSMESTFSTMAQQMADELKRDKVIISIKYYTSDGTEIISKDISNK